MGKKLKVIGAHESYFTGKLETYLRTKGIAYENVPFTPELLQEVADQTGIFQIPQVLCPDGSWLVDTTLIIDYLDRMHPEPVTTPIDPEARFVALLLEDYADEWLWRPAMHFRWSYANSSELLSSWLSEHIPDPNLSLEEKKAAMFARQKGIFVDGDGVTSETRPAVESSYYAALSALEEIFKTRDFILGDRPTRADFGFMGPMFRHFFCDPDPGRIMRDRAPGVLEWVARMWNMKPQRFASAIQINSLANDLGSLLEPVISAYLPYLKANQDAVMADKETFSYEALDVQWTEPAKPYRLWCLDQLRRAYGSLDKGACARMDDALGSTASHILSSPPTGKCDGLLDALPISKKAKGLKFLDSWWRRVQ